MNLQSHNFSFDGHFPKSKYCDVKLSTLDGAGRHIAAHKVVLAAVSPKLEKFIDRTGEGVGPVTVRNIRFDVLEKIVEFIYSGRVEIEDADVEDFQDGLDMLRIRDNKQEEQNETMRSINVPVSEVGNVPVGEVGNVPVSEVGNVPVSEVGNVPVGEVGNVPVSEVGNVPVSEVGNVPPQLFLPTPTTYEDDQVNIPNNWAVSNNPRTVSNSSVAVPNNNTEAVPNNNTEDVQEILNFQDGFVDVLQQSESLHHHIKFDSRDAQPRSRLSNISSSDSNSENVPHNSTPLLNIPKTFSFLSPAVSNISVAVRKPHKYRSQAEIVSGDSDRESVTSSIMKALNPWCDDMSEVSSAESEAEPEEDDTPPMDQNMNNIPSGNSIIKYNVSKPILSRIRCPFCELQLGFKGLLEHCKVKHPKDVKRSEKVVCNVCHRTIASYIYELHQQVYHTEKVRLGMAGSSRIMEKDSLMRFNEDFKNSEKDETNNCSKGVDTVTEMSTNLKRSLDPEEVGNYNKLKKTQKMKSFLEDVSNPKFSLIRCPFCEVQLGYKGLLKHCKVKHPKAVESSEKVVCNVCRQIVPSYSYELHQQVYHLGDAEKVRLGKDDLGMAGSSRIMEKDNLRRFHADVKNSEKEKMNHNYKSVDTVTEMSENLKRRREEVGNDNKLKSQKRDTHGQFLSRMPERYKFFLEDVPEEGVERKQRKVRCWMCRGGKLHLKRNISRHFAIHLPDKCPRCGKEFNDEQMKEHTKLCQSKNAQVPQGITALKERARLKFVMGKFSATFVQKARSPILKSLEEFSHRAGVLKKCVQFKIDNRILDGSEMAFEFDEKTIAVSKC